LRIVSRLRFEWDPDKASRNVLKHGVGFEEARTVFGDPLAAIFDDVEHALDESREIIIGCSTADRLLLVSFVERRDGVVRVISARTATRRERTEYEKGRAR
jgi:uncharacterized protein